MFKLKKIWVKHYLVLCHFFGDIKFLQQGGKS